MTCLICKKYILILIGLREVHMFVFTLNTNKLQSLPEGVFDKLAELKTLDLRYNQLWSFYTKTNSTLKHFLFFNHKVWFT